MWTTFTEASMNPWAHQLFMPLVLIVNYTLCEYLLTIYWSRRKERRIRLLFAISLLSVLCLVPFANEDEDFVRGLNDFSESCVVVTFLIQITVIGYDVSAKFKIRSVMYLTYAAELLIVVDLVSILLSAAFTFAPSHISRRLAEDVPNVCENITLVFIFVFRFYYVGISRGWRSIWRHQKLEFTCYLLFSLHELPFVILEDVSGLSWEHPQALWNRVTIATCLVLTARGKLRGTSSRSSHATTIGRVTKTSRRDSARSSVYASATHLSKKRLSATSSTIGIMKVVIQQHSTRSGRVTTDDSGVWSKGQSFTNQSPIVVVADAPLEINAAARQLFLPLILLINYTLLQYLLFCYWKRRRETRTQLLFAVGFIGVACLISFANPDTELIHGLNDVSESCCVVTFLIQITVIGHDLNARFRLPSVMYLTRAAEVLIFADIAMIGVSFVATFAPGLINGKLKEEIPNVFENATLFFIFFFRFYYIAMSRGWRVIVRTRKVELVWYVLSTTHELPFELLLSASGLPWEFVQALYMCMTIAGCLFLTANGKIKSVSKYNTSVVSVGGGDGSGGFVKRGSLTYRTMHHQSTRRLSAATTEPKIID